MDKLRDQWVEKFEKFYGRKPEPKEFMEAKQSGFDLSFFEQKLAKTDENRVSSEASQSQEVYDVVEEPGLETTNSVEDESAISDATLEQTPAEIPSVVEQDSNSATSASREQWMTAFEKYVGHQPSPQEFMVGKQSGFDLTSITPFIPKKESQEPSDAVEKTTRQRMPLWRKLIYSFVAVLILALIGGYMYGSQYFSRQAVAERYLALVKKNSTQAIYDYEVWSDTKQSIKKSELKFKPSDQENQATADSLMQSGAMVEAGNIFLVFPNWKVAVTPASATIKVNTKGLDVKINDQQFVITDSDHFSQKLSRLYPGTYDFTASGKVDGQDISVSDEKELKKDETVDLQVKYLSFTIQSNLSDGDAYVGSRKIGTLTDGMLDVQNLAVTSSASVYVQKKFGDKDTVKTETTSINNITDGETVSLDAAGQLDRDTADDLITQAYSKLSSYSYDHTTPSNLTSVFSGGNNNSFYTDVKGTIDANTTGAKNRSADSISFSDVDVTKVTQTGAKTYTVEFTVVYDFYYSYSSSHPTSGDIKQKLAWSANVEYVGKGKSSDDSYYSSSSSYSDYRVTSSAGKSSVISTDNTVD